MPANPIETELALIRRDIQEINAVLYGNGKDRQGLIDRVETSLRLPIAADGR